MRPLRISSVALALFIEATEENDMNKEQVRKDLEIARQHIDNALAWLKNPSDDYHINEAVAAAACELDAIVEHLSEDFV